MKDFPFGLAIVFAFVLHTLVGLALHHNFLILASPAPAANEPVTVQIVDVPKGGPALETPPPTRNLSDANRKAGPFIKTPNPPALRPPPEVKQRAATSRSTASSPRAFAPPSHSNPSGAAALPSIQEPSAAAGQSQAEIRTGNAADQQKLQKSLRNLDRFITPGGSEGQGISGDRNSAGDALQGDPGSGVFFDTRGFDLGPWSTRVVAIVKRNWLIPVAADLGVKGVVGVAFEVEKSGRIDNIRIISSSSIPSFDQAAVNALTTSNPLPPLPGDFPRPTLAGIFRFYYNVPVPNDAR